MTRTAATDGMMATAVFRSTRTSSVRDLRPGIQPPEGTAPRTRPALKKLECAPLEESSRTERTECSDGPRKMSTTIVRTTVARRFRRSATSRGHGRVVLAQELLNVGLVVVEREGLPPEGDRALAVLPHFEEQSRERLARERRGPDRHRALVGGDGAGEVPSAAERRAEHAPERLGLRHAR